MPKSKASVHVTKSRKTTKTTTTKKTTAKKKIARSKGPKRCPSCGKFMK